MRDLLISVEEAIEVAHKSVEEAKEVERFLVLAKIEIKQTLVCGEPCSRENNLDTINKSINIALQRAITSSEKSFKTTNILVDLIRLMLFKFQDNPNALKISKFKSIIFNIIFVFLFTGIMYKIIISDPFVMMLWMIFALVVLMICGNCFKYRN